MGAALDGVDGAGNLVGTVVPEPAGVAETHGHVAGLGRGETDLVVGSGVPELQQTKSTMQAIISRRQVSMENEDEQEGRPMPLHPSRTDIAPRGVCIRSYHPKGPHTTMCHRPPAIAVAQRSMLTKASRHRTDARCEHNSA